MEEIQLDDPYYSEIDFLVDEDPEELERILEDYQRERERTNAKTTDLERGFEKLPRDVFLYMSGYIEPEQLSALCRVNKNFYNHICNSRFWLQKLMNTYGVSREYIDMAKGPNNTYYGLYQELEVRNSSLRQPTGFNSPIRVNDNMIEFIRNGDFGLLDPNDPNSPPLNQTLMILENGITNRLILIQLFNIYAAVNNMRDPANRQYLNRQYLTSTPAMDQYFEETFKKLSSRPQIYKLDGTPIPKFDPKHFRFASIPSIISDNIDKRSQKLIDRLGNVTGIKNLLERENDTISKALAVYKDRMRAAMGPVGPIAVPSGAGPAPAVLPPVPGGLPGI